jgi:hypothetical protein
MRRLTAEQRGNIGHPCIVLADETVDFNTYCQPGTGPWLILLPEKPGYPSPLVSRTSATIPTTTERTLHQSDATPQVETYLLAQHSDGPGTTQLIHNLRPQHVVFVHGSPTYLADLTSLEELQTRYHLHSPSAGTIVELPIGETFLQPAPPETNYEGELNELGSVLTITLPGSITTASRWRNFADTGLVEARWQGEELVLRGLSQREIINQSSDRSLSADLDCCSNCRFQRGQRCLNQASPLFGFKVTPDGYCPAFERQSEGSRE